VNAKAGANTVPIQTTVKYAYSHGDLMTITYPSGRVLVITRDTGELIGMSLAPSAGGTPVPLISNVKWEPFGPVSGWDWNMASGLVNHMRQFDLSGRIVRYPLGNVLRDVSYDAADRITGFSHLLASDGTLQPALNQGFVYDENSRLTSIVTSAASWSIAYDPNGNRTSVSLNGIPSTYTTETTSNRLTSITNPARSFSYDNAGNTTVDSANYTATYGLNGAIASITKTGVTGSYDYDADRRRIRKVTSTGEVVIFVYDLEGQLLGEYDQTGNAIREYVWLDSIPVAMFTPDPSNANNPPLVYYIHADHLNAPRVVVDTSNQVRWQWLAEPFGTTAPMNNPSGLGAFTQNLRFPGQYADTETGLWYNHFRTLDSTKGGYTQSDPAGLAGGVNTYAYVEGNPLLLMDPSGLWSAADLPTLDQGLVDAVTGFGDGISFFGFSPSRSIREGWDIDGGVRCTPGYQALRDAGQWYTTLLPIAGRLGYMSRVAAIPKSVSTVPAAYAARAATKSEYRSIMRSVIGLFDRDPSLEAILAKAALKGDAYAIARAGVSNPRWNAGILGLGGLGVIRQIINSGEELCECQK
jgi:RHS repeat-associated protein